MKKEDVLRAAAESIVAINFTRELVESAPLDYFSGEAKQEFGRITSMVRAAKKLDPGTPSETWATFLRIFVMEVVDNAENIEAEIKSALKELKAQEKKRGDRRL